MKGEESVMQSKDIILHVAEETAEVMEDITEQLFDETDARFNEIAEAIQESIEKIQNVHTFISDYASASEKRSMSSQDNISLKLVKISESLDKLSAICDEDFSASNEKSERLLCLVEETSSELQLIKQNLLASIDADKAINSLLQNELDIITEKIVDVLVQENAITDLLSKSNTSEKLDKLLSISSSLQDILSDESQAIDNVNQVITSFKAQSNKNTNALDEKLNSIMKAVNELAEEIGNISRKQEEMIARQLDCEKALEYLKLPFYKKWVYKGEE